jgi:hypothetical protein
MILGDHSLPSARRVQSQLRRHVLSEYRESDPCWFSLSCAGRTQTAREYGMAAGTPATPAPDRAGRAQADRCCPVLEAISDSRLTKGLAQRGGMAGEP